MTSPACGQATPATSLRPRMPAWLRRRVPAAGLGRAVQARLRRARLHTVCEEASCPNRGECFGRGTATFLILGDVCTRHCGFCGVTHGVPAGGSEATEAARVVETVRGMGLRYVVVTSVTRDDLPDGGAAQFAALIAGLRVGAPGTKIEVLIPDFQGNAAALRTVLEAQPDVLNHNIETVERLYAQVRPQADYRRSLTLLARAATWPDAALVKSGMMVGLGERPEEVIQALADLHAAGCSVVTIGQYLQPSRHELPVREFVTPEQFEAYAAAGCGLGLAQVISGPFVRSSYRADRVAEEARLPGRQR
jgi:lipoyl synthase